jgi:hypothetical protein
MTSEIMDTWNREKTVVILEQLILYFTYTALWALFGLYGKAVQRIGDEHDALGGGYGQGRSSMELGLASDAMGDMGEEMAPMAEVLAVAILTHPPWSQKVNYSDDDEDQALASV